MKSIFVRLVKLAAPFRWWMLLAAFLGFLTVGSSIGLMMTSAYIVAKAALHPSIAALQVAIVGVRFFGISRGIFRYLERIISHEVTFKLLARLRVWFYMALEPLAPSRLQRLKSGDLLSRIISDINTLENFYIRVLAPPLIAIFVSLLMWFLFGLFSWTFSAILFSFFLLAGIGVPLLTHRLSHGMGEKLAKLESELSVLVVENIQGLPELLLFGQTQIHLDRFLTLNDQLTTLQRRRARIFALHESLLSLLMNMSIFAIFIVAIPYISAGLLDGIYLAVLALGTMAAFEAVTPLPAAALYLQENLAAAKRLFDMTHEDDFRIHPVESPKIDRFDLSFHKVDFAYNEGESLVLKNFNLEAPAGNKIALCGPSGVGKTTIANMVMRFWQPQAGDIRIGGHSIKQFSPQELTNIFSYVPQNPFLFGGTIRDNLLLASPTATESQLLSACRLACIDDFVQTCPNGLDTWIGEYGLRLSGGERQRLALARGLVKETPIYIFDEPTSHVDAHTAVRILDNLLASLQQRTVFFISHDVDLIHQFDAAFDEVFHF